MTLETRRLFGRDSDRRDDPSALQAMQLDRLRAEVEDRMEALLADAGGDKDLLAMAMRAGALSSGKRMRPLLLMLVARDLGCSSPGLIDAGCALEMVHAASLILDDMPCMDDAQLRRGKPAVHAQYGEDVAILAAIALLSSAFGVLSSSPDIPPAVRARLVCRLSETVGARGLARGQFEDLRGGAARSADEIAATNDLKTGILLGVAVDMAAIIAECEEDTARSLRAFAMAAGQAFQIMDDFKDDPLNPYNDSAVTGKDTGKDVGKATLINMLGREEASRRLTRHLDDAERHLLEALGPRQATRRFLGRLFADARGVAQAVADSLPALDGVDALAALDTLDPPGFERAAAPTLQLRLS